MLDAQYRLRDDPEFRRHVGAYRGVLRRGGRAVDSKGDALLRALRDMEAEEPGCKVVVFSFFKGTLAHLGDRLAAAGIEAVTIHGDVPSRPLDPPSDERGRRVERFLTDPSVRVLLSSEVGSEGLDFHEASCRLVNYDLPWNPMVVEQRIGRLDRYGQPSPKILVYHFSMPGTVEDRVLERLYDGIGVFQRTIGDLEPILGEHVADLERTMMSRKLSDAQKEQRAGLTVDALETRRLLQEQMEQQSAAWMGQDDYFDEQVRQAERRRRFLSPEELQTFVGEFMGRGGHGFAPAPETPGVWELTWSKALAELCGRTLTLEQRADFKLLGHAPGRRVEVAFDSEIVFRRGRDTELLCARHPLVRAIYQDYKERPDRLHPVARVEVASRDLPEDAGDVAAGRYLYRLYLLDQRAAVRPGKHLEAVFVGIDGRRLGVAPGRGRGALARDGDGGADVGPAAGPAAGARRRPVPPRQRRVGRPPRPPPRRVAAGQ